MLAPVVTVLEMVLVPVRGPEPERGLGSVVPGLELVEPEQVMELAPEMHSRP